MRKMILLLSAIAVSGLMTTYAAVPAAAGPVCKGMVWGYATKASKHISRIKARMNWKANAGPGWNNTGLAKQKSKGCRKQIQSKGHGPGVVKWKCFFKARPCKKLGISG